MTRTIELKRYTSGLYRGYPDPWWPSHHLTIRKAPTGRAICKEPSMFTQGHREVLYIAEDIKSAKRWISEQEWGGKVVVVADYYKFFKKLREGKVA